MVEVVACYIRSCGRNIVGDGRNGGGNGGANSGGAEGACGIQEKLLGLGG